MEALATRTTRCLLVHPRFSRHSFWNYSEVCELAGAKYPAAPLGLMTVAALLPQHWEFRLVDENVAPLVDAHLEWADIVFTGGMLPQQGGIVSIVERAHEVGRPVVVGGPDPTSQPHLYQAADFMVLGEGEITIPTFVEDLGKKVAGGEYRSTERADMARAVVPRFDLIRFGDYVQVGVQFSRGCPYNCEFCDIIELFGRRPRTKFSAHLLAELEALFGLGYRGHIDFVDDNFVGNTAKVRELLKALRNWSRRRDYPFYFSTEASINLAENEELLRLMQENDFRYVFVGFESPDEDVLVQAQKLQNQRSSVIDAVRELTAHGMIVNGGFILGFDGETAHTAGHMIDLIQGAGICMAMVGTLYALPNTQLSRRLRREGRLFGDSVVVAATEDIDQMTSGLNYATSRPRAAVLRDHAEVLRRIYDPRMYFERVLCTAASLGCEHHKPQRPTFPKALRQAVAFLRVCARAGLGRGTGLFYWKTLLSVIRRNPQALGAAVNLAAMYLHFSKQAAFVIRLSEQRADDVSGFGEENYDEMMTGKHMIG